MPLLHQVIPIIDSLTTALDEFIDNAALGSAVRHAALRGMLMLNKYYGRTDESILYRIAMSKSLLFKYTSYETVTISYSTAPSTQAFLLPTCGLASGMGRRS